MNSIDIFEIGAFAVKKGVVVWQGLNRTGPDATDIEPMGEGDVVQGLGFTSAPYPSDDRGKAEGVGIRGIGGRLLTWLGARDTRSAEIVGKLRPGDTVMHSTGPSQAAQVQCKEGKRQVLMATKDESGGTMMVLLDGKANKFQIILGGCIFEINGNNQQITMKAGDDAILLGGGVCAIDSHVLAGGTIPDPSVMVAVAPGLTPGVPATPGAGAMFGSAKGLSVAL